jgi:hypothetical protein
MRHNRVTVDGRVQETTTKTRSGRRIVPLSDAGVAALLSWQLRQAGEAEAAQEAWETQGHVFTMEDGRPLDPACVTRLFQVIRTQGEPLADLTVPMTVGLGLSGEGARRVLAAKGAVRPVVVVVVLPLL